MLGISLRSVIIGCNCITKVLLSDEKNRSKMPLLAVQIDGSFISLNIYENNQLSFSRFASIDAADYDNSADYVYEAVNENIFRMLQFHRSRNAGDPIRNVVLYGDTKEYMRISKDLEQMDINTTVISVPKNVKGYQNLDFALYANAIGAMFPRNRATEKINLLEFGGSSAMVIDKVKSDSTFNLIFAGAFLASIILMGGITGALAIRDAAIKRDIKKMNDYLNDPKTIEQLAVREQRLELQKQVKEYKRTATLASDALNTQPYIISEVYTTIEKVAEETVKASGVSGLSYSPKDNGRDKFQITGLDYSEGIITLNYSTFVNKADPVPTFSALFAENLEKTGYFENIDYTGFDLEIGTEQSAQAEGGVQNPLALNKGDKLVSGTITMTLKSPVNYEGLGSYVEPANNTETEAQQ
jgi:type IV pilus assembly protein PilM